MSAAGPVPGRPLRRALRWTTPEPALDTLLEQLVDRIRSELREPRGVWGVEARREVDRSWPPDLVRGVLEYGRERGVLHPRHGPHGGALEWHPVAQLRFIVDERLPLRWRQDGVALSDVTYCVAALVSMATESSGCEPLSADTGDALARVVGEDGLWLLVDVALTQLTGVDCGALANAPGSPGAAAAAALRRCGTAVTIWDLLAFLARDGVVPTRSAVEDVVAVVAALSGRVTAA